MAEEKPRAPRARKKTTEADDGSRRGQDDGQAALAGQGRRVDPEAGGEEEDGTATSRPRKPPRSRPCSRTTSRPWRTCSGSGASRATPPSTGLRAEQELAAA